MLLMQRNLVVETIQLWECTVVTVIANSDLENSYKEAEENFRARNPKSATLHEKSSEVMQAVILAAFFTTPRIH